MPNLSLSDVPTEEGTSQNGTDFDDDGMEFVPPQHLLSDYVEIAYLGLVICAGLVLNVSVLKRLLLERRRARRSNKVMNGFLLLKLNLNVSDILILLIHASGKLGWLITYEWRGGDALCRLFNLLSMFTLYLSSNIVICIALDRLFTVLTARRMDLGQQKLNLVRLMLILAWTFSLLFSLPQLFVWTTYNPFKGTMSRGWVQCTDIWSIDRYERYLSDQSKQNLSTNATTTTAGGEAEAPLGNWPTSALILQPFFQNSYELSHLFLVFYGPLIVLVICYLIISSRLIRFAANNPNSSAHTIKNSSSNNDTFPRTASYTSAERRQMFKRSIARTVPSARLYNSAKWRRKSHLCNNQQLHMLQHAPLMDIVELSLVKTDEASNGTIAKMGDPATVLSSCREQTTTTEMPENADRIRDCAVAIADKNHSSLMVNPSLGKSAISLPIVRSADDCSATAAVRSSASSDQLINRHHGGAPLPSVGVSSVAPSLASRYATASRRNSMSCCSSTIASSHDLKTAERRGRQKKSKQQLKFRSRTTRKARLLYRIRESFRESFGRRRWLRRSQLDDAELTNSAHCLSSSSLSDNCARHCAVGRDRRDTLPDSGFSGDHFCCRICCPSFVQWVGRMKHIKAWKTNENRLMSARNSMALSVGGVRQNHCVTIGGTAFDPAGIMDGTSVPPTPLPRPPSSATAYPTLCQQQNGGGDVSAIHSVQQKAPLFSRNHSVRSSYSTTVSIVLHQNGKSADTERHRPPMPSSGHFLWRHRSRAFRTTLLVILVHIVLWSPYNVYALMKHINEHLYQRMNEQANVLKHLQFLITLINPFLYGFGRSASGGGGRKARAVGQRHERA